MYTDEDLAIAVRNNIFNQESVLQFRQHMNELRHTQAVDEENFRLVNGFNDVFVVIASALLLTSLGWLGHTMTASLGGIAVAAGSWALAEYFVNHRRMALPAITLLLSFLGSLFAIPVLFMAPHINENTFIVAGLLTTVGAIAHWIRFRVPITIAAGTVTLGAGLTASLTYVYPSIVTALESLSLVFGLLVFGLAMYWDSRDTRRQSRDSDVAFWLHLIAAPMIVHPVFQSLGVLNGNGDLLLSLTVLALYVLLAFISLIVDRRAIMVSALVYVMYTFSSLLENVGIVSYGFALTGLCLGSSLLVLCAYWQSCRAWVFKAIPATLRAKLPVVSI